MSREKEEDSLFFKFKKTPAPKPAPLVPPALSVPAAPARAEDGRTARLEASLNELKAELAALRQAAARPPSPPPPPPPPPPIRALDPMLDLKRELAAASEGVKHSASAEAGFAVRMERAENLIAELKALVSSQQAQLNKNAEQRIVTDGLTEYRNDLIMGMNARIAEAENNMRLSLADMSARLTGSEAVYRKMFSDAESLVRKSTGGELASLDDQLKRLRESVVWLTDEYKIVIERKIRALEGKGAAFEAIARRMDTIDAALKKTSDKL